MAERNQGVIAALAGNIGGVRLLPPALLLATGLLVYFNSFWGKFLFDDRLHILGYRRLTTLWPPWEAMSRHRPVVDYSLALNYAICGAHEWGYHAVNVAVHLVAGLTLYGIVLRTLLRMGSREESLDTSCQLSQSQWCAFAIAAMAPNGTGSQSAFASNPAEYAKLRARRLGGGNSRDLRHGGLRMDPREFCNKFGRGLADTTCPD